MITKRSLWLALLLAVPTSGHAQDSDAAKLLGQTRDSGSLPLSSKPSADARQDLGKIARSHERGVFLVGHPKTGIGTAWVISKKHRLLVTNAHVADIRHESGGEMIAIPSGTAQIYSVARVWYHPGVRRYFKDNQRMSVRSMDPNDGTVDPHSPDLAILQLSDEGPELSVEFPLATAEEFASLFGQSAAIVGFPGHDTSGLPRLGEKAAATIHDGVVSRLTDFHLNANAPPAELQFLQYTMSTWGGFSGSPVFLANGRVAAVHNMARYEGSKVGKDKEGKDQFHIISIPHGIRVDCVLEMFVHHSLDGKLPFKVDKTAVAVDRWTKPDPRGDKARADYAEAISLTAVADHLVYVKYQYDDAVDKCTQALKLVPNLAVAFRIRSAAFNNYYFDNSNRLSRDAKVRVLKSAFVDAVAYSKLVPTDPGGVIHLCRVKNNIGRTTGDVSNNRDALTVLNDLLTSENRPTYARADAHSSRGVAHDNCGEKNAALRDHNEAIRLRPDRSIFLWNRASFWEANGRSDLAAADRAKAKEMDSQSTAKFTADLEKAKKSGQTIVLVEWKAQWYHAAVLKTEGDKFYVHYLGDADSWNEWVTKDRIKPVKD